jgi:serine/threonine protein kinase
MSPEKLSQIRRIYEGAIVKHPSQREAYLDLECHGDEEIRAEIERLLVAHEHVPDWLDRPLLGDVRPAFERRPVGVPLMAGRRLSGYTLIREIGWGGMGSVYLAERSDGAFQKQVAIKLVQPGRAGAAFIGRFKQERAILASLDHPNIARLMDAGATEEGLPYLVMELVEGQPINQWCDERKLDISERIKLLRTVCAAVRHAHQHLVVHRDLKPGNILVTSDGTVKLLDFGIAKLLEEKPAGELPATQTLDQMMTPDYASPEQVSGGAITTLTDVYSLGVICYELLTGHRPYRLTSAALHEMARVISEVEPARPSAIVDTTESRGGEQGEAKWITPETVSEVREGNPAKLRNRLKGDLDCIVLTALQKEPARRYSSVEALDQDLRRHLEHRPVAAKPDDAWYRANRFIRRHPAALLAEALVLISLVSGMAALLWQARLTLDARQGVAPGSLWFTPFWVMSSGFALAGCCAAAYFFRPSRMQVAGTLVGGAVYGMSFIAQYWIGFSLGWWRSRLPESSDPLRIVSVPVFVLVTIVGTVLMLILLALGRRFGWKGQSVLIILIAFGQPARERIWFTTFLPVMTVDAGIVSFLAAAAIYIAGLSFGLLIAKRIGGGKQDAPTTRQPTAMRNVY